MEVANSIKGQRDVLSSLSDSCSLSQLGLISAVCLHFPSADKLIGQHYYAHTHTHTHACLIAVISIHSFSPSLPLIADILDRVAPKLHELGLDYECVGGGRIRHDNKDKKIHIYGYSVVSRVHLLLGSY